MAGLREKLLMPDKRVPRNPMMIVVNMLLASIVVLFLALTYGYALRMGSNWLEFKLPKVFWLSTICILLVSFFLRKMLRDYDNDRTARLRRSMVLATIFATAFIALQLVGWGELGSQGILLTTSQSASYLYLLSGLHLLHVGVGIVILLVGCVRLFIHTATPVKSLIYYADPIRRDKLKLLVHYWHTIDFLWLFLFLVILYNHT
jgi:cytochrome c oxidase subunit 3